MPKRILNRALELWRKSSKKQRIAAAAAVLVLFVLAGRNGDDKDGGKQAAESGKLAVAAPAEGQAANAAKQPNPANLKTVTNSLGMDFVLIPKGEFNMGFPQKQIRPVCDELIDTVKNSGWYATRLLTGMLLGGDPEEMLTTMSKGCESFLSTSAPQHKVAITRPYYLASQPVTQEQWSAVMDKNPSSIKGRKLPVTQVSWDEAQEFIRRLNEKEGHQGYRLPTEAEWEYAMWAKNAPTDFRRAARDWVRNQGEDSEKEPEFNAWGLNFDGYMEWVQDWYSPTYYRNSPTKDPQGPAKSVCQGGSLEILMDLFLEAHLPMAGLATIVNPSLLNDVEALRNMPECRIQRGGSVQFPMLRISAPPVWGESFRLALGPSAADAVERAGKDWVKKKKEEEAALAKITHTNSIGMKFRRIPAGKFMMGCDEAKIGCSSDAQPRHEVTISRDFWMGQFEVTQAQWEAVMGEKSTKFKGPNRPVERVSWDEAQEFIRRLNEKEGHQRYRLPTEAEWEYAARAGTETLWFFGADYDNKALWDYAWCGGEASGNSGDRTHPVGQKDPNPWGLYDIYGNVEEWVQDWYDDEGTYDDAKRYYRNSPPIDPAGPEKGQKRVLRGGEWLHPCFGGISSSTRHYDSPNTSNGTIGFRLAMDTVEGAAARKAAAEKLEAERQAAKKKAEEKIAEMAAKVAKIPPHTNSIGIQFLRIPAGKFMMGCDPKNEEECNNVEQPRHEVTISRDYWLGQYEVTQKQWEAVMGNNPSRFKGADRPVEQVSWNDAQEFIKKLNEKEGHDRYRLPTEAEWEYAARAGSDTDWFFGNDPAQLGNYAWYKDNAQGTTHPVGQKEPNNLGLYDMYGNVVEWVQDWLGNYNAEPAVDPKGPEQGEYGVFRGGSWWDGAKNCRAAVRQWNTPGSRYGSLGFRLAMTAE